MKKLFSTIVFFLIFTSSVFSLEVSIDIYGFSNLKQNYTEATFRIIGNSVTFVETPDLQGVQASVEILMLVKKEEEIVYFEKYILNSPISKEAGDFLDMKRFSVPQGLYTLEVEIKDLNSESDMVKTQRDFRVDDLSAGVKQSSIQLLANQYASEEASALVKNGVYMEPLAFMYSNEDQKELHFYNELYNIDSVVKDDYYIGYGIYSGYKGEGGEKVIEKFKRYKAQSIQPMLLKMEVEGLLSGNYHLELSVFNMQKEKISSQSTNFIRSNPKADLASLNNLTTSYKNSFAMEIPSSELSFDLKSIFPLVGDHLNSTLNFIISKDNEDSKRAFIFKYWSDQAPGAAKEAYEKYREVAKAVHERFYNSVGYGFETDRGYIYLKYGKPSDVLEVEEDPSAPPYQIWKYNYLPATNQTTVKFIFYNPSLSHNDYSLLHSTCRGEKSNPAWEVELYRAAPDEVIGNPVDATTVQDNFNRNAKRYFNDF